MKATVFHGTNDNSTPLIVALPFAAALACSMRSPVRAYMKGSVGPVSVIVGGKEEREKKA